MWYRKVVVTRLPTATAGRKPNSGRRRARHGILTYRRFERRKQSFERPRRPVPGSGTIAAGARQAQPYGRGGKVHAANTTVE